MKPIEEVKIEQIYKDAPEEPVNQHEEVKIEQIAEEPIKSEEYMRER